MGLPAGGVGMVVEARAVVEGRVLIGLAVLVRDIMAARLGGAEMVLLLLALLLASVVRRGLSTAGSGRVARG